MQTTTWTVGEKILGRYLVSRVLHGGMGTVYLTWDPVEHERYAVKSPRADRVLAPGNAYLVTGQYAEAEAALRRSLAIREKAFGPEHVEILLSLYGLGRLYRQQGRWADLDALLARALPIAEGKLPAGSGLTRQFQELRRRP